MVTVFRRASGIFFTANPRGEVDLCQPQNHPCGGENQGRACSSVFIWEISKRSVTGAMPPNTWKPCGACCNSTNRTILLSRTVKLTRCASLFS